MPSVNNGQKLKLRYLFTATFQDGTTIEQTPEDVSKFSPPVKDENGELKGKSRFFDVLEYEKESPLVQFSLKEVSRLGVLFNQVDLDLTTGIFTVNGLQVNIAEQLFIPQAPLRLIYVRETHIQQDVSQKTGKMVDERFYVNRFLIGWQTLWKNQNYQCTIAIDGK